VLVECTCYELHWFFIKFCILCLQPDHMPFVMDFVGTTMDGDGYVVTSIDEGGGGGAT
jgi:hypothetical protein